MVDHAQTRRHVPELFGDRLADARLQLAAYTALVTVRNANLDTVARQRAWQQLTARWAGVTSARSAGPLAGIPFDRLAHRAGLIDELRKRQPQLIPTYAFRFLAEEPLTQNVELMAERR